MVERLLRAIALILIARQVGPAAFGQYTASLALTTILSVGFGLGLDVWLVRNGNRTAEHGRLAQLASTSLVIRVGLGLGWLAGLALLVPWLDANAYPPQLFLGVALAVWLEEIANLVWSTFKAALQNQTLLKFVTLMQALFVAAIVLLMVLGVRAVLTFVWLQVAVAAIHALVAIAWQIRTFGWRWAPATIRPTLRATFPFALSTVLAMIYGRADIALAASLLGERAAGLYAPAVSLANALALIPTAMFFVMVPVLSREYLEQPQWAERTARRFVLVNAGLGLLAGGALALLAGPIVRVLYGPAFAPTAYLLAILGGVLAARFVSLALATVLVAVDRQTPRVAIQAIVAVLNIGLNLWLIRQWGLPAVAGVYVLTEWLLVVGYAFLVWLWRRDSFAKASVSAA
jgi:O-antigen/teichoic acid export membrane protein